MPTLSHSCAYSAYPVFLAAISATLLYTAPPLDSVAMLRAGPFIQHASKQSPDYPGSINTRYSPKHQVNYTKNPLTSSLASIVMQP